MKITLFERLPGPTWLAILVMLVGLALSVGEKLPGVVERWGECDLLPKLCSRTREAVDLPASKDAGGIVIIPQIGDAISASPPPRAQRLPLAPVLSGALNGPRDR